MSHVIRSSSYERTLVVVLEKFPDKFSGPIRDLEAALAEPLSDPKPRPFVNPCPTVKRLAQGEVDPEIRRARFAELLKKIRTNWGLPPELGQPKFRLRSVK